MMEILAGHLSSDDRGTPVAIAVLSEPAFVQKDKVVRAFLSRTCPGVSPRLAWLVGTDTLYRFFDPRCESSLFDHQPCPPPVSLC